MKRRTFYLKNAEEDIALTNRAKLITLIYYQPLCNQKPEVSENSQILICLTFSDFCSNYGTTNCTIYTVVWFVEPMYFL